MIYPIRLYRIGGAIGVLFRACPGGAGETAGNDDGCVRRGAGLDASFHGTSATVYGGKKMSASILDIARSCHVSPEAVSSVLGAYRAGVSEELRARIVEEAKALGYADASHSLGVLFMDESAKGLTHPFFAMILNAFKLAAEERGYDVTFINRRIGSDTLSYLEYCRCRGLAGVCIACVDFSDPQVAELVKSGIPCVTVDHIYRKVPSVLSDNETGVQKLVEYAISMGHTRIAFINGHNNSVVTRTRIKQFYQTMQYHGLPVPDGYVCDGLYGDIGLTRRFVDGLLSLPERPTCIFLPDDSCYLGAQEATRALNLRIPEDVSFVGYDGIPLYQQLNPRLTTIRQNCDSIGETAATRLIAIAENRESVSWMPVMVPVELLEGGTVSKLN